MFCENCGREMDDKELVCKYCGNVKTDSADNDSLKKMSYRIAVGGLFWEILGATQIGMAICVLTSDKMSAICGLLLLGIINCIYGISRWFKKNNLDITKTDTGVVLEYICNIFALIVCFILREQVFDYIYMAITVIVFLIDIFYVELYSIRHKDEFPEAGSIQEKHSLIDKIVPIILIVCIIVLIYFCPKDDNKSFIPIVQDGCLGEYTDVNIDEVLNYYYGKYYDDIYWEEGTLKNGGDRVVVFYATQGKEMDDTTIQFKFTTDHIFTISGYESGLQSDKEKYETSDVANDLNIIYGDYYKNVKKFDENEYENKMEKVNAVSVIYGAPMNYSGDRSKLYKKFDKPNLDMSALELMHLYEEPIEQADETIMDEVNDFIGITGSYLAGTSEESPWINIISVEDDEIYYEYWCKFLDEPISGVATISSDTTAYQIYQGSDGDVNIFMTWEDMGIVSISTYSKIVDPVFEEMNYTFYNTDIYAP